MEPVQNVLRADLPWPTRLAFATIALVSVVATLSASRDEWRRHRDSGLAAPESARRPNAPARDPVERAYAEGLAALAVGVAAWMAWRPLAAGVAPVTLADQVARYRFPRGSPPRHAGESGERSTGSESP